MFRTHSTVAIKRYRLVITGLLALSVAALAATVWVMVDLLREQEIVADLIEMLPPEGDTEAEELAGELRWQFRMTMLVVLNLVVAGFALLLLSRAYSSSQETLRDVKAFAADVLNSMEEAIITTDRDNLITSINRRGLELLGTTEECIGKPLTFASDRIPLQQLSEELQESDTLLSTKDISTRENSAPRTVRVYCQQLQDRNGKTIGKIFQVRDVTERTLIDERLRRMERYMGLGSLAAGLHHEIKNPLAGLSLHVQLLEEQMATDPTTDDIPGMIQIIKSEVGRIGSVLEGFGDFASIDNLSCEEVQISDLVQRQTQLIRPQCTNNNVRLSVQLPDQPLPKVEGDRVRLEQVLLNLLVNAIEAMPNGGDLHITAESNESNVVVNVTDTGNGIPSNRRSAVFDPYFTTKSDGTGLGLAICDKIMRQHQGSLEFTSSGDGTTFVITLPHIGPKALS